MAGNTWRRGSGVHFLRNKKKNRKKRKKERFSKQKLLKNCHQGENITVSDILERLEVNNTNR